MEAMVEAAYAVSQEMQGFKGAYIQSDEVTFMLADFDSHETQGWFGYKLNKIVSISASLMTAYFLVNYYRLMRMIDLPPRPPVFDSRAFIVPIDDAPNVFIWRQQDWMRNSVQMLARANFSHKALDGKGISDMHDMLHRKGINWATDCSPRERNGTFMFGRSFLSEKLDYDRLEIYLGLLREHKNA
jgi:tRNA(His) 5'-end guanylyltransferase